MENLNMSDLVTQIYETAVQLRIDRRKVALVVLAPVGFTLELEAELDDNLSGSTQELLDDARTLRNILSHVYEDYISLNGKVCLWDMPIHEIKGASEILLLDLRTMETSRLLNRKESIKDETEKRNLGN